MRLFCAVGLVFSEHGMGWDGMGCGDDWKKDQEQKGGEGDLFDLVGLDEGGTRKR